MCLNQVEEALEGVKNAINEQDLANRFKEFGKEMVKLNYVAARRQQVSLNCHKEYNLIPNTKNTVITECNPLILKKTKPTNTNRFLLCLHTFFK